MRTPHTASHPLHAPFWHLLAWTGVLLIAAMLTLTWRAQNIAMSSALAVFLASSLLVLRLGSVLPSFVRLLLVLTAVLNGAGGAFDWFESVAWFDELAHAWSGFAGMSAIGYAYARDGDERKRRHLVGWCTGMGLVLGIGWEIIEELLGDLEALDTLSDLVMDVIGAWLGGVFARHAVRQVVA